MPFANRMSYAVVVTVTMGAITLVIVIMLVMLLGVLFFNPLRHRHTLLCSLSLFLFPEPQFLNRFNGSELGRISVKSEEAFFLFIAEIVAQ